MSSHPGSPPPNAPDRRAESSGVAAFPSNQRTVTLDLLDRLGCGYLVVEGERKILEINVAASLILGCDPSSALNFHHVTTAFRQLVARIPNRPKLGPLVWIVIWNKDDAPFILNQAADDIPPGISVVMLIDLDARLQPNPFMLRRMFGLTAAETRLALQLARGDQPADIARKWNLSRTTIRSQLAALFMKTNTKRQAELVTLLARLALVP